MGLLERVFGRKTKADDQLQRSEIFRLLDGYRPIYTSWCGELYESELVRAAIDAKARQASKLEMVMAGEAQQFLRTRIKHAPNEWQTWSQFMYRTMTILEMRNNCFIVPVFDEYGRQIGYHSICARDWELVTVGPKKDVWIRFTFFNGDRAAIELNRVGILTKFQYKNDMFGEKNDALDDTMKLIDIQRQGIQESAKNASYYRLMARVSNFTKPDDLAKERQRFDRENFQNGEGRLLLLPNTYTDIQQVKQQSYEVDTEQLKLIRSNVFNYFGVNEDVLQNKAVGDAWAGFYEGAIEPFAIQLAEVMTKMTFSPMEQSNGNAFYFTANRLQYLSNSDKLRVSTAMLDRGVMSLNEVREIWNLEPVDGGDERIIRGEYYNADEKINDEEPVEPADDNNEEPVQPADKGDEA